MRTHADFPPPRIEILEGPDNLGRFSFLERWWDLVPVRDPDCRWLEVPDKHEWREVGGVSFGPLPQWAVDDPSRVTVVGWPAKTRRQQGMDVRIEIQLLAVAKARWRHACTRLAYWQKEDAHERELALAREDATAAETRLSELLAEHAHGCELNDCRWCNEWVRFAAPDNQPDEANQDEETEVLMVLAAHAERCGLVGCTTCIAFRTFASERVDLSDLVAEFRQLRKSA